MMEVAASAGLEADVHHFLAVLSVVDNVLINTDDVTHFFQTFIFTSVTELIITFTAKITKNAPSILENQIRAREPKLKGHGLLPTMN